MEALQHSPLLKLIPELRNEIYKFALTSDEPIDITVRDRRRRKQQTSYRRKFPYTHHTGWTEPVRKPHIGSLRFTCRFVFQETEKMFYAANTWRLPCAEVFRLDMDLHDFNNACNALDVEIRRPVLVDLGQQSCDSWRKPIATELRDDLFNALHKLTTTALPFTYKVRISFDTLNWNHEYAYCTNTQPEYFVLDTVVTDVQNTLQALSAVARAYERQMAGEGRVEDVLKYVARVLEFDAQQVAIETLMNDMMPTGTDKLAWLSEAQACLADAMRQQEEADHIDPLPRSDFKRSRRR